MDEAEDGEAAALLATLVAKALRFLPKHSGRMPKRSRSATTPTLLIRNTQAKPPTQFWCTCHWITGHWSECKGCGDVLLTRWSNCVRDDHTKEFPQFIDCNQATLDTYGSCCYSPLFATTCGGCKEDERQREQSH